MLAACTACIHSASFPSGTQRARAGPLKRTLRRLRLREGAGVGPSANKAVRGHEFAPLVDRDLFKREGKEDGETDFGWSVKYVTVI